MTVPIPASTVRMLLTRVAVEKTLPFEVKVGAHWPEVSDVAAVFSKPLNINALVTAVARFARPDDAGGTGRAASEH